MGPDSSGFASGEGRKALVPNKTGRMIVNKPKSRVIHTDTIANNPS